MSAEASVTEASGPTTWCTGQTALYCEDFDAYSDLNKLLNAPGYTYSTVGGKFALAGDAPPSDPSALEVTSTATSDVKTLLAKTLAPFSTVPTHIRMEFALKVNKAANIGYLAGAAFAAILNGREVTDGGVAMAVGQALSGGTNVFELGYVEPQHDGGPGFSSKLAQGAFPPLGQWIGRYAIDIQYAGSGATRTGCARLLAAAGVNQLDSCLALPATLSNPRQITVVMGLYSAGLFSNSGNVEIELDNVIVTAS